MEKRKPRDIVHSVMTANALVPVEINLPQLRTSTATLLEIAFPSHNITQSKRSHFATVFYQRFGNKA